MPSFRFPEFDEDGEEESDISQVLKDYLKYIANKKLRIYTNKEYIHTRGDKIGQSLYSHVMDLITIVDRLSPVLALKDEELRCVFLGLTIHDINKISAYGKNTKGWELKYADTATINNIQQELDRLQVEDFFPAWREYLLDIVFLAHAHQAAATGTTITIDQRYIDRTKLKVRLKGPLKCLMQAADASDNSHSGDHRHPKELHLRDKVLSNINAFMDKANIQLEYRFIGHRLAELRGLITNVIHNVIVTYLRDKYGERECIDLQYYPEGVNYLLDTHISFEWNEQILYEIAEKVRQELAKIQFKKLAQFIKAKPDAITVDDAAMSTGASFADIFEVITLVVVGKQYTAERKQERNEAVRNDLATGLAHTNGEADLTDKVQSLLLQVELVPDDEATLKRGEFVSAYRKFLKDHCSDKLKLVKEDAWVHVYRLFRLIEINYKLYDMVNPYRRGYFIARDLPTLSLDEMKQIVLEDLIQLERQAAQAKSEAQEKKTKKKQEEAQKNVQSQAEENTQFELGHIIDYLKRNLEVWDSVAEQPLILLEFGDSLRQYANAKRPHEQCCHCGSALPADEWMAVQVPASISVQSFSNRLEGGASRDPKRNVCEICRAQFILEKLAWRGHRDKQNAEQVILYLHLFPYAYFTRPLLRAWWLSVNRLKDTDHSAFFFDTKRYFRQLQKLQGDITIEGFRTSTNGLNLPVLSDAISNTPVLPIVAPGANYGEQFMLALEKAVLLVRWFECRAILTRSAVPPLNLAHEKINGEPVVLMVEDMPRNMSWLVPRTSMIRADYETLAEKLSLLHQLAEKLYYVDTKNKDKTDQIPHDFATAATDDLLALYFEADRWIEKKVAARKGEANSTPEIEAIHLSKDITPILDALIHL